MGIPDNLYACAVCEESFPIAKSLVNHVNENHVSVPSTVELKQENYSKVVKSLPSSIDNIENQKENNTKVDTIKFEKEKTKRLKNVRKKGFINIATHGPEPSFAEPKKGKRFQSCQVIALFHQPPKKK